MQSYLIHFQLRCIPGYKYACNKHKHSINYLLDKKILRREAGNAWQNETNGKSEIPQLKILTLHERIEYWL